DLPRWAGLALAGLTAIATVQDTAQIREGHTVLVHGGSGGVGQLLIPMALEAGAAQVWATGREANAERIRDLGATPIPYDATDWTAELQRATDGRGVDVVLDTHYHSTFLPSLDQIAEGGLIVTLPTLADISPATERGLTARIRGSAPAGTAWTAWCRGSVPAGIPSRSLRCCRWTRSTAPTNCSPPVIPAGSWSWTSRADTGGPCPRPPSRKVAWPAWFCPRPTTPMPRSAPSSRSCSPADGRF